MKLNRTLRNLSVLLFSVGFLIGLALAAFTVWADLEAALFDSTIVADAPIRGFRCPLVITTSETGIVSATFPNPAERSVEFNIRARISSGYVTLMREVTTRLPVEPGEARRLEWEITANDRAFGRFVLVRVHSLRIAPHPYRNSACGVVVADVPFLTGGQIVAGVLVLSVLGMGTGARLWMLSGQPVEQRTFSTPQVMGILAALVGAALVCAYINQWIPGMILLILSVLLLGAIFERFAHTRGPRIN